ncbi:hypothetical protein E4Q08_05980 [Candidatus Accumulibacter phosphatis]|uniref:Uncharacterized protein n=1 Tax=Candidatus Accumulibacter contiguus TaxID=2954381 RepID=A0ABX1T5B5_9PROT|nr:hypothetical protein [Candidatus Accumulibacter contiguus]NMQ04840.1 hypothetical protein [Candidatus Accumulibacter contiguus]
MKRLGLIIIVLATFAGSTLAQNSQRTKVQGNTEINATTKKHDCGCRWRQQRRKKIVSASFKVTQRATPELTSLRATSLQWPLGETKKACTNIGGVVSNECK